MREEYVGWLDDEWNTVLDQDQPITRCRDCKHNVNGACARWDYCDIDGSNGFCAWGELKEGGE